MTIEVSQIQTEWPWDGLPLSCPKCRSSLSRAADDQVQCPACEASFPVQDGIPVIRANRDYYHELLPKERMHELIHRTREIGWRLALAEQIAIAPARNRQALHTVFADESRAAFKAVLPPLQNRRVLDLGCGSGVTSIGLARWASEVVACDLTFERVAFLALRAREAGLRNIRPVCAGDTRPLPFPDGSFDCVVLNGVLEWSAATGSGPVREEQLEFLREVRRILRPDGHLYIGIENRYGFRYFFGAPEDHTGVKYAALVPRWLADRLVSRANGHPYRTYTYGRRGMSKLLREGGFPDRRFFAPIPDYRDFREIYPLDAPPASPNGLAGGWRTRLKARLERNRWFTPSFAVLTSPASVTRSWVETLADELASRHAIRGGLTFPGIRISATSTAGLILSLGREAIVRVPLDPVNEHRVRRNFEGIARAQSLAGNGLRFVAPRPLADGTFQGIPYAVESSVSGAQYANLSDNAKNEGDRKVFGLLVDLKTGTTSQRGANDPCDIWKTRVIEPLATLPNHLRAAEDRILVEAVKALAQRVEHPGIPLAFTHGDFWSGNILFPSDDRPLALIDWDRWAEHDFATNDLLHYICYRRVLKNRSTWPEQFVLWLDGNGADDVETDGIRRFADRLGLDSDWRALAGLAYWVREATAHDPAKVELDSVWSAGVIRHVAPVLLRHLAKLAGSVR